ncbi:hypothetical protein ACPXA2_25965, partial [Escherichia coli]
MNETIAPAVTVAPKPASPASTAAPAPKAPRKAPALGRLLPIVGPIALFVIWDLVVRAGWIKAILL